MKLLTLDDDVGVEGGDPLGRDGLLVRVEVVEVALGGDQAEAERDQQHWEPHPDQITAHWKTEKKINRFAFCFVILQSKSNVLHQ